MVVIFQVCRSYLPCNREWAGLTPIGSWIFLPVRDTTRRNYKKRSRLRRWFFFIEYRTIPVLRIRDVYPGSRILIFTNFGSRISDPGSKNSNKREGWKKICCHYFLYSHKFHKIANYFSSEVVKKKIWANFQRIIELFTQKIVTKLSKIWIWDPGSGIRKKPIPDPGSRGQKGTGSQIRIRNTARYCDNKEKLREAHFICRFSPKN